MSAAALKAFLDAAPAAALVEVAEARGSTPREKGARMLVSPEAIFGTIGGGQLEYMAIDQARALLAAEANAGNVSSAPHPYPLPVKNGERGIANVAASLSPSLRREGKGEGHLSSESISLSIALGPEIGQCCGGRVEVAIRRVDRRLKEEIVGNAQADDAARPHVYLFGGGHVGHALAAAFALLPVHVVVVETRADALDGMPDAVETRLTPVPEEAVREAPKGAAFLVLTHDHALDFLIVAEALRRDDAAYVGMIGSQTKKATFRSWYQKTAGGTEASFRRLVSPIGGDAVKDKRPPIIAAMAVAEVMTALARTPVRSKTR